MTIEDFTQLEPTELIGSLDNYQQEIVRTLLKATDNNYLESADKWLSASPSNTAKFGGDSSHSTIYREKVVEEIEKFLCGNDNTYEEERKNWRIIHSYRLTIRRCWSFHRPCNCANYYQHGKNMH